MKNTSILFFSFICIFLTSSCSGLFYQPSNERYSSPEKYQIDYDDIHFTSLDGTKLHGWLLKSAGKGPPKSTVIFFHGNAENITSHYQGLAWMTRKGHDVFIFDYRGYGESEGIPSQEGIYNDAITALERGFQLHEERGSKKLIVYGQSLGGVISLRAVPDFKHKNKIDLLVQDSAFASYKELANQKMKEFWITWPFSPFAYLTFSDEYASKKYIDKISPIPILVIHGDHDQIVPLKFGEEIFALAHEPKWLWKVKNGVHIDAFFYHDQSYRIKFLDLVENKLPKHDS